MSGALIIAYTVVAGVSAWIPVVFICVGAFLLGAAFVIGNVFRSIRPAPAVPDDAQSLYPPEERRRDIHRMVMAAVITLVVVGAIAVTLQLTVDMGEVWYPLVALSVAFALMIGGGVSSFASIRIGRRSQTLVDGDFGRLRAIARVVARGKNLPLTAEDELAAARYAPVAVTLQIYQLVNFTTLYIALGLLQINSLASASALRPLQVFSLILLAFLAVTLAVLAPVQIAQIRRTRAYARAHPYSP